MLRLKLNCEIITPMFMFGADSKTPELRPTEFKGMMRWWWRAIKAEDNIEKLKKEESEIFGGSSEKHGKSKVIIRVYPQPNNDFLGRNLKNDYSFNWNFDFKIKQLVGSNAGIGYILYSTVLPNKEKSYIKPGLNFYIEISSFDENAFKQALASLWVSIYLGGFGTRARRGAGNITIVNSTGNTYGIEFIPNFNNTTGLRNWIENNLKEIKKIINQSKGTTEYTNLKNALIQFFEPKNSWEDALNFIGEKFKNFRDKNKNEIFKTPAFGMPIMHEKFSVRIVPYKNNKRVSERWASPLILKIIKSNNDLYFPIIIKLSSGGVNSIGKEKKRKKDKKEEKWILDNNKIKKFDESLVNEFLNNTNAKEEIII